MSGINLDAIQARADAATEGPWETRPFDGLPGKKVVGKREPSDLGRGPIVLMQPIFWTKQSADNAEFIAAARSDVPVLVAALRGALDAIGPHWDEQVRREARFGRTGSSCVCYGCNAMRAVTAHIDTTPEGELT